LYDLIFPDLGDIFSYSPLVAQKVFDLTQKKSHFYLSRLDRIWESAWNQNTDFFKKNLNFTMDFSDPSKPFPFGFEVDGFFYECVIIKRNNQFRKTVEIKLPNDGFIYRELQKYDRFDDSKLIHNVKGWYMFSKGQMDLFRNIKSLISNFVLPLFQEQPILIMRYTHLERRFDVIVRDRQMKQFFEINFEDKYLVFSLDDQQEGVVYSEIQKSDKIFTDIEADNLFF